MAYISFVAEWRGSSSVCLLPEFGIGELCGLVAQSTRLLSVCSFAIFFFRHRVRFGQKYSWAGTDSWKYEWRHPETVVLLTSPCCFLISAILHTQAFGVLCSNLMLLIL